MEKMTDIDLLLIGKTGNGKSATGNSILKRRAFLSRASLTSITTTISSEVSEYKGRIIKVVDGPGVGDTRLNSEGSVSLVVKAMEDAIKMNTRGYHAFLLVIRFGGRYTQEDRDTIKFLKDVFGPDFVKNFCILVMTCGDSFEYEKEYTGQSFEEWCKEQEGVFQELLVECNHRIVLFNNVTKSEAVKNDQIDRLMSMVNGLVSGGQRYTDQNFARADKERRRAIVESKKPMIREGMTQETSLIIRKLDEIRNEVDVQNQPQELEKLLERTDCLLSQISNEDNSTGALKDLIENVKAIRKTVTEAADVHNKMQQEREVLKRQEEEMKQALDKQMQNQKEEMKRAMEEQRRSEEERREAERQLDRQRLEAEIERRKELEAREERMLKELAEERKKQNEHLRELDRQRQDIQRGGEIELLGQLLGVALQYFFPMGDIVQDRNPRGPIARPAQSSPIIEEL